MAGTSWFLVNLSFLCWFRKGDGTVSFPDFLTVVKNKWVKEEDTEKHFKDAFRVFSKDEQGEPLKNGIELS